MSKPPMEWSAILVKAVSEPGVISDAYRRFWNYSTGNQLLAIFQCHARQLEPGPINTFMGWKAIGRSVKKGEKALTLCMPVTRRTKPEPKSEDPEGTDDQKPSQGRTFTQFVYRASWFVLSQTEGQDYVPATLPTWDQVQAFKSLDIDWDHFTHTDGNVQGYARGRQVAVSPVAFTPLRTLFHEVAHVVLGHTAKGEDLEDGEGHIPLRLCEAEAESVAMICCECLGLRGAEFSRGYIQHWLKGNPIPPASAQRIFKAADEILKAGRPTQQKGGA